MAKQVLETRNVRSPWGNYFKEFLMLFLAVFCGYLAEDFRESHQEKVQAEELAQRFYRELKADSVTLSKAMTGRYHNHESLHFLEDSFSVSALEHPSRAFTLHLLKTFYRYGQGSFAPKHIVLEQVRLSAGQDFFQRGNLQQLVGDLSTLIKWVDDRNEVEYTHYREHLRPFMLRHFEASWLQNIRNEMPNQTIDRLDSFIAGPLFVPPRFRNLNQLNIPDLVNMLSYRKEMSYNTMVGNYGRYALAADTLRNELRKIYHLKD